METAPVYQVQARQRGLRSACDEAILSGPGNSPPVPMSNSDVLWPRADLIYPALA